MGFAFTTHCAQTMHTYMCTHACMHVSDMYRLLSRCLPQGCAETAKGLVMRDATMATRCLVMDAQPHARWSAVLRAWGTRQRPEMFAESRTSWYSMS